MVEVLRAAVRDNHGVVSGARVLIDARRSLGFATMAPPERSVRACATIEERRARACGAVVELDGAGIVTSIERLGGGGTPSASAASDAALEGTVVGAEAPSMFLGGQGVPTGASDPSDEEHFEQVVRPAGHRSRHVRVTRAAVRAPSGELVGVRILIEAPVDATDALEQATAYAGARAVGSAVALASIEIDAGGTIVASGGDLDEVFSAGVGSLVGRSAAELDVLIPGPAELRSSVDLGEVEGVRHHAYRFAAPNGRWQVRGFYVPSPERTIIWMVGTPDVDEPTIT